MPKELGIAIIPTSAPDFFTEDTPDRCACAPSVGAIAQFEKASAIAKPGSSMQVWVDGCPALVARVQEYHLIAGLRAANLVAALTQVHFDQRHSLLELAVVAQPTPNAPNALLFGHGGEIKLRVFFFVLSIRSRKRIFEVRIHSPS
jgi:hypothetical protein